MQTQLIEHLHESEGMKHQNTIDRPFSEERALSPAERDAENAAFLSRVRAAALEVMTLPDDCCCRAGSHMEYMPDQTV